MTFYFALVLLPLCLVNPITWVASFWASRPPVRVSKIGIAVGIALLTAPLLGMVIGTTQAELPSLLAGQILASAITVVIGRAAWCMIAPLKRAIDKI